MNSTDIILAQLSACHDTDGWFSPLQFVLENVSAQVAVKTGEGASNSIYGIVQHLVYWNERYLTRFIHGSAPPSLLKNRETFENGNPDVLTKWEELKLEINNVFMRWRDALQSCDESKLQSRTPLDDKDELWWMSLANLTLHNAYHIGQIVHILKEHSLWRAWEAEEA